ncbi:MAG TPA: hypothetical protein VHO03_03720 [Ignavibacteriales bacterium]|nr:hypothetical protein [Ignavibacteriales bacterium]
MGNRINGSGNRFSFKELGRTIEISSIAAANRAADTAVTRGSSLIRERYNVKKRDLDKSFLIFAKAKADQPFVIVKVRAAEFPLYDFNATQTGKPGRPKLYTKSGRLKKNSGPRFNQGVKATVARGERKLYRSADNQKGSFIATVGKGGHIGVFIRTDRINSKGKEIIKELFGLSLTRITLPKSGGSKVIDSMDKTFKEEYFKRLKHELERRKPQ